MKEKKELHQKSLSQFIHKEKNQRQMNQQRTLEKDHKYWYKKLSMKLLLEIVLFFVRLRSKKLFKKRKEDEAPSDEPPAKFARIEQEEDDTNVAT